MTGGELKLDEAVLELVRRSDGGKEQFVLHPLGAQVVARLVDLCVLSTLPEDVLQEQLLRVVAVCSVLKDQFKCPSAARSLFKAVIKNRKARSLVGASMEKASRGSKQYRKFVGDSIQRAPSLADEDPEDALKLKSFLNTGKPLQRNAVASKASPETEKPKPKPNFDPSNPRSRRARRPPGASRVMPRGTKA